MVGVSRLRVYEWPTVDGKPGGGTPHLHLTCGEGYVVTAGRAAMQTLTTSGYQETPLEPGTVAWFTPGTIHRLVNESGLDITVVTETYANAIRIPSVRPPGRLSGDLTLLRLPC